MPSLSKSAYYKQVDNVLEALEVEAKEDMKRAGARLRQIVFEENEGVNNDNDIVDVAVSFDGTWAKRGFTSLTGIVFAISVDTGEVLDYHVLSKACQKCSLKKTQCGQDNNSFEE